PRYGRAGRARCSNRNLMAHRIRDEDAKAAGYVAIGAVIDTSRRAWGPLSRALRSSRAVVRFVTRALLSHRSEDAIRQRWELQRRRWRDIGEAAEARCQNIA